MVPPAAPARPTRRAGRGGRAPRPRDAGEAALVAGLRRGDPEAARQLHDRYGGVIATVLARTVGRSEPLADLVQDVFVRALAGIGRLRNPARLWSWLAGIAEHTGRAHVRRAIRDRARVADEAEASGATRLHRPPDVEVIAALGAIRDILATLPPRERTIFTLRIIHAMKLTDVAQACGLSLATVKRVLRAGSDKVAREARHHPAVREWMAASRARWGRS